MHRLTGRFSCTLSASAALPAGLRLAVTSADTWRAKCCRTNAFAGCVRIGTIGETRIHGSVGEVQLAEA